MPRYGGPWDDKRLIAHLARGLGLRSTDFRWVTIWGFLQEDDDLLQMARADDVGGDDARADLLKQAKSELERYRRYGANQRRLDPVIEAQEPVTASVTS